MVGLFLIDKGNELTVGLSLVFRLFARCDWITFSGRE